MAENTKLLGKAKRRVTFSESDIVETAPRTPERTPYSPSVSYGSINGAVPIYPSEFDSESVREVNIEQIRPGHLTTLSSDYESLNYDTVDSQVYKEAIAQRNGFFLYRVSFTRWAVTFFIGVCTALVGCSIDICIAELSRLKYTFLQKSMDEFFKENHFLIPYAQWAGISIAFSVIAAMIVTFVEPVAAGSGIPLVKAYLNGINIPRLLRIKTLLVKSVGVTCSVLGGLAVGKEGPMVHSGSVVAAGLSQGKSTTFRLDLGLLKQFRMDQEKRDFVSGGAAAGVAAAFGAPIGGVLFSLEEGSSFWNQSLTWRIFFCSMISAFTLNAVLSTYHGQPGELAYPGLLNFGKFHDMPFALWELPIFVGMGILGGLSGALFNQLNYYLSIFRAKYMQSSWKKVLEVIVVCWTTISVGFAMIYYIDDCKSIAEDNVEYPIQMFCKEGEYNAVAAMWFQTPEASVRALFHDTPGTHRPLSVILFFLSYFLLSCWTYGLCISSGVFIPSLLSGAAWGRLLGLGVYKLSNQAAWADPGKYALIGAAAQLGGIVRMTLSLTVILIETTGNISLGLGLMLTLMTSKWVGDLFNMGIYDMHIQLAGLPIIPWAPPPLSNNIQVKKIISSSPVVTFKPIERVTRILDVLQDCPHNGFPVTDGVFVASTSSKTYGKFQGLILRYQVLMLLKNKLFCGPNGSLRPPLPLEAFKSAYPRYASLKNVEITEDERKLYVDLRPYLNPAPYTIRSNATLPQAFNLFRALGLRHLVVTDDNNEVVGILTRKDIARHRSVIHCRRVRFVQLPTSSPS